MLYSFSSGRSNRVGVAMVKPDEFRIDESSTDEEIEAAIERGRKEYYAAWHEYVREYE